LKFIIAIVIVFSIAFAFPQTKSANINDSKPQPLPFSSDEELFFVAEFSRAILRGLDIAELRLKATRKQEEQKTTSEKTTTLYNLTAETKSKGFAPKLFGISFHQLVDSVVDPSSFRVVKDNKLDQQNKRVRNSETVFDKESGKVTWTETDPNQPNNPPRVVTNQLSGEVQDIASAFYYLRLQPLKVGQTFTFKLHDSGEIFDVAVKVTERKQMKTILGKVWTIKIEPDIFGKLLDGEGYAALWFTDDSRRIPVKFQIKHRLGTVDFKLKKISNPT
jgi:hypothetical protein